jgi:hypothetical protein
MYPSPASGDSHLHQQKPESEALLLTISKPDVVWFAGSKSPVIPALVLYPQLMIALLGKLSMAI